MRLTYDLGGLACRPWPRACLHSKGCIAFVNTYSLFRIPLSVAVCGVHEPFHVSSWTPHTATLPVSRSTMSHTPSSLLPLDASALYGELRSLQQTPEGSRDPERLAHLLGALDLLPAHVSEAHMRACVEDLLCTEFDHILTSHGWVRQEERIWHKTPPSGQTIETSYLGGLITSSRHLDTHHGYTDKWFARLGVTRGFDEFQSLVMSYRHDCEASYECEDDTYRGLGLDEALIAVEIKRRRRQIEAMLETLPDTQVHQARRADYLYALEDLLTQSE